LTSGAFSKNHVFWAFWRFSGWISAKLALIENAIAIHQLAVLAISITFYDILARARAEIKIYVLRLFDFWIFFSPFLFLIFFFFCCSE